jgi:hypothetical protein
VRRRRESRREEWTECIKPAGLLDNYLSAVHVLDIAGEQAAVDDQWFVSKEARRAERACGCARRISWRLTFLELKSRRGLASRAQKQLRLEMLLAGSE